MPFDSLLLQKIEICCFRRPPWVPTIANIALGAVLGYIIQHSIFKEAPRVVPKVKQTAREISQRVVSFLQRQILPFSPALCLGRSCLCT